MSAEFPSKHKKIEIFSYSGGSFLQEFISTVFGSWIFFFYEIEVGLNSWLITLGYTIYAVWNALNSPLLGYYTNKETRFTKSLGRHFPWIMISAFPWFLTLYFVYSPPIVNPQENQALIFIWFTIFICIYSFFFTIFGINYGALFPKKFRTEKERRKASGIIGAIAFVAMGVGSIFPALFIKFNDKLTYSYMALYSTIIAIIVFILTIHGIREKKKEIDRYYQSKNQKNNKSFLKTMKYAMKQRNFVLITIILFLNLIIMQSVGAAFPYIVKYVFNAPAIAIGLISLCYLVGAVVSMPVWTKLGDKINSNKKMLMITGTFLIFTQFFLIFVSDLTLAFISAFLYGFCMAGFYTILSMPINADMLDELAVKTGERNESTYMGIRGFFVNFSIVALSAIFAGIHEITGFVKEAETQTILAQWGIRFTLALVPMICTILALFLFWKFYDITPEKKKIIDKKLSELNL
ncbi:MAG: MFS transporter [Promethearchaeota archaeon]